MLKCRVPANNLSKEEAMSKIKLFKLSHRDAVAEGFKEDLMPIGMVTATSNLGAYSGNSVYSIEEELIENAKKMKATHVFGIEFRGEAINIPGHPSSGFMMAYGDAYTKKK